MQYVQLGKSGLRVSRFAFGNWVNSEDDEAAQKLSNELVQTAWNNGINLFDTSEAYSFGKGERQIGVALQNLGVKRSDYVLTLKLFIGKFPGNANSHNNMGTSRKRLFEGVERSLKNLGTDYADVLFCHRYDNSTPTIEVIYAVRDLLATGKVHYWATSSWPQERIMEAMLLCDRVGCQRPIAEQCQYNMLTRDFIEEKYVALFDDYGLGTTVWSPLCSGILTGKYNNGIPEDSRFGKNP